MHNPKKPLIVSINGVAKVGVSSVVERLRVCLTSRGLDVLVDSTDAPRDWDVIANDIAMDEFDGVDVMLIDRHPYTVTSARRGLHKSRFRDQNLIDLSILLTCDPDTHKKRSKMGQSQEVWPNKNARRVIGDYLELGVEHYGTDNHHTIITDGPLGILYAAGAVRQLIDKELRHAKDAVA